MASTLRLVIRRDDDEVASVIAGDRPIAIGRSRRCDVVLDDPAISRFHCVLATEDEGVSLTDQESQNGLWVHGKRVHKVWLKPDLPVVIGPFRVTVQAVASGAPVPASSAADLDAAVGEQDPGPSVGSPAAPVLAGQKESASIRPVPATPGKRSTVPLIIASIAAVILVVGVGALFIYRAGAGGQTPTDAQGEAAADPSGARQSESPSADEPAETEPSPSGPSSDAPAESAPSSGPLPSQTGDGSADARAENAPAAPDDRTARPARSAPEDSSTTGSFRRVGGPASQPQHGAVAPGS